MSARAEGFNDVYCHTELASTQLAIHSSAATPALPAPRCTTPRSPHPQLKKHLGVHVVDTADADHEQQLCLRLDIEAAVGLGLALEADKVLLLRAIEF